MSRELKSLGIAPSNMRQSLRFNFLRDLKPKKDAVASAQSVEFLRATTGKRGANSLAWILVLYIPQMIILQGFLKEK